MAGESTSMESDSLADLEAFCRKCIAADSFPGDDHVFTPFACETCGVIAFAVTIEHQAGSKERNFRGLIHGVCKLCGRRQRLFLFGREHRETLRTETPACTCGNEDFLVAECDRMEREGAVPGFFDEGVVAGRCSRCGENRAFVYID